MYKLIELIGTESVAVQLKMIEVIFVVFPELGEFNDTERPRTVGSRNSTTRMIPPSLFIAVL